MSVKNEKQTKNKKNKISSVGAFVVVPLIAVAISCGSTIEANKQSSSLKSEGNFARTADYGGTTYRDDKATPSVMGISQVDIHSSIDKLYFYEKERGIQNAFIAVPARNVTVNGVTVDFKITKDVVNNQLKYVITKLKKGTLETVIPSSDISLNGVIAGFNTQDEVDVFSVTQQEIHKKIDDLFLSKNEKIKGIDAAFDQVTQRNVIINGVNVEYKFSKDVPGNVLTYKVIKLKKGSFEKVMAADESYLNGTIWGFNTFIINTIPTLSDHFPVVKGFSGYGSLNRNEVYIENATPYFRYKINDNDNYQVIVDNNALAKDNWLQVTWIANPGYVFANGLNQIVLEQKLSYLVIPQDDYIVNAITQQEIHTWMNNEFNANKPKGLHFAFNPNDLGDFNKRTYSALIKGVAITIEASKDVSNNQIKYEVKKLKKGNFEKTIANSDVSLNGKVTGFATPDELDVKALTQQDIYARIDRLFTSDKPRGIHFALHPNGLTNNNPKTYSTVVKGVSVVIVVSKDVPNNQLQYVVTKLKKGNFEKIIPSSDVSLNGKVSGFKTQAELDAEQKSVEQITQQDIQTTIDSLYLGKKEKGIHVAFDQVTQRNIIINEVNVEYKVSKDIPGNKLTYEVIKLKKGSFEKVMAVNETYLNGAVTGFNTFIYTIPTLNNYFPIIKGPSGFGVLTRNDARMLNVTTYFKYKRNDNDYYRVFSKNDDFTKDNWLQVTWIANPGYVFANGLEKVIIEQKLDYLLPQDQFDVEAVTQQEIHTWMNNEFNINKPKGIHFAFNPNDLDDINKRVYSVVINGVNVSIEASKDVLNNQIKYVVKKLKKGNFEKIISSSDVSLNGEVTGFTPLNEIAVNAITQQDIYTWIDGVFSKDKSKGLNFAFDPNNLDTFSPKTHSTTLKGVMITVITSKDTIKNQITYVVTKLKKGDFEKTIPSSDVSLNGEVTGFTMQGELVVDAITKQDIHRVIDGMFIFNKPKGLHFAFNPFDLNATNTRLYATFVRGANLEVIVSKDVPNYQLTYVVTKLSKGGFEKIIPSSDVSLNGKITGFATPDELEVNALTQQDIYARIDRLFTSDKPRGIHLALNPNNLTSVNSKTYSTIIKGVSVVFTISQDVPNNQLTYVVDKLQKGSFEKIIPSSDVSLSGKITGFATPIEVPINMVTPQDVYARIDRLYASDKPKGIHFALRPHDLANNYPITYVSRIKGVDVTFIISKEVTKNQLVYLVTKLSKDGVEKTIPSTDISWRGKITGFAAPDEAAINIITQQDIYARIDRLYTSDKPRGIHLALNPNGLTNRDSVTYVSQIKGVNVSFTISKDVPNNQLTYVVNKLSKGAFEKTIPSSDVSLNGEITGFATLIELEVNALTQQDIYVQIDQLFAKDKPKGIHFALHPNDLTNNNPKTFSTIVKGISVVILVSKDAPNDQLTYVVTKLSKDGFEKIIPSSDVSLSGKITGFITQDELDVNSITKQDIHTAIDRMLYFDKPKGLHAAFNPSDLNDTSTGLYIEFVRGVKLEVTVSKDVPNYQLTYVVNKLSKGAFEKIIPSSDVSLNGKITGFATPDELEVNALTQQDIYAQIDQLFASDKPRGIHLALNPDGLTNKDSVTYVSKIKGVDVSLTISQDVPNNQLTYVVNKLSKGAFEKIIPSSDLSLNGKITGFAAPADINMITQQEIYTRIDRLYASDKPKGIHFALHPNDLANINSITYVSRIRGVDVSFTISKDVPNNQLTYVVNKLSIGDLEKTIPSSDVSLNGKITGFASPNEAAINMITKQDVYVQMNKLYASDKLKGIHSVFHPNYHITYSTISTVIKGVTVIIVVSQDVPNNQLTYVVIEMRKGGLEKVVPPSDVSLNGKVTGFITPDEIAMNTISQQDIYARIDRLYASDKPRGIHLALDPTGLANINSITYVSRIKGVDVSFTISKDVPNNQLTYVINKLSKGSFEKIIPSSDVSLNGKITGFITQDELDINSITKLNINMEIDWLYVNVRNQGIQEAFKNVTARKVVVKKGVLVEYTIAIDAANNQLAYVVTKLSKGGFEKIILPTNTSLNGVVINFKVYPEQDINNITKENIHGEINKLYSNQKSEGIQVAFNNVVTRDVVFNGVMVEYTIAKDIVNDQLVYVVTKLSKSGFKKIISPTDTSLNGIITGFKTQDEIDVNSITKSDIYDEIDDYYATKKGIDINLAFNDSDLAATEKFDTFVVNGVKIFVTITKDAFNNQLTYVVTNLQKNNYQKIVPATDSSLNGVITGFYLSDDAYEVNIITKADIAERANMFYDDERKSQGLHAAFNIIYWDLSTLKYSWYIKGVVVDVVITKDVANNQLKYVVTKLSRNSFVKIVPSTNESLNGVVTGFPIYLEKPTIKDNFPVLDIVSNLGVLTRSDADLANTTTSFRWKATEKDTYSTFVRNDDFMQGNWLEVTWTAKPGFIFKDGSKSVSLEKEVNYILAPA